MSRSTRCTKSITLLVIAIFITVCLFPLVVGASVEKTTKNASLRDTLYVGGSGPGNYTTIQEAIDDANRGDAVFVFNDSSPYNENIIINKSINLIGEDRDTTVIDGNSDEDVITISADWVNISGFTIFNGSYSHSGILLMNSSNCIIEENMIIENEYNIYIKENSCNNLISKNVIISSIWQATGIGIAYSNNNVISWNVVKESWVGIAIGNSVKNEIYRNNITQCDQFGLALYHSFSNIISQNNFINNELVDAFWVIALSLYPKFGFNKWMGNYWSRSRVLPKPIFGFLLFYIPWLTFDFHPALEPYDIS